jgi:phage gpG-like protein
MEETALRTELAIVDNTPVDEGVLRNSWTREVTDTGFTVGSREPYAPYPEFGTHGPITPTRADNLVFTSRRYGNRLFVLKQVAGQKAQYFVRRALQNLFPGSNITPK